MEETFKNPPNEYRMLQIIHHYYDDNLAKNYKKLGFGGVVANVSFNNYLEDESAWDNFIKCLNSFRDQGLLFWIYDEKGYPSGKAGGLTLKDHPEFEALGVLLAKTEGKGTIHHKIPIKERISSPPLSIVAVPILNDKYDITRKIDLTDKFKQGKSEIVWNAPNGKWCIMSFHISKMYEGTHCVTNYSDPLPYINIIDRDAVARFIHLTHDAYKQKCGNAIRDYVQAFFTDEPSLMTLYLKKEDGLLPPIPWSNSFRQDFQNRMGYDIVPYLPYLFVDCGEDTVYKRIQFWKVVSELIEENFYGQIQDWCNENGTKSSGHALWEEHLSWHVGFEGDLYRDLRRMDIPGIDILSSNPTQHVRARHIPIPKFVSSVTHLAGKELCMSETSSFIQTMTKQPCSFEQRIGTINWQYALGLTCITSYYRLDEFKNGELNIFNEHIGRLGFMLTGGRHIADIAVFYPIHSFWAEYIPTDDIAQSFRLSKKAKRINNDFSEVSCELLA
ncbi:MAG: glycosyl hydrolase, partial [Candidatus Poribacteria bacterium]